MSPSQRLQRLLAEILTYKPDDIVAMLPLAAALVSALCARVTSFQQPHSLPDIDYLLTAEQTAHRVGKSPKWVREHIALFPFAFLLGQEHRFSAKKLDRWIAENSEIQ
ncbi:MAG: hypothetical protein OXC69_06520 [Candidatus Tectomicrobia bacterium]|nr:hypothetical protein [Candidatus Tectomicrobia bacterium]